ncbi:MAG: CRISPR-associated endoribonuclease Cas6 [Bacteroides sp.]|nr:CRISPR-associated endoribonuclease Cas6 [Bacteroides sp.]MCM1548742.1 CRISPR-associated endoribonuclease Cas6 [Clostridium sp.]
MRKELLVELKLMLECLELKEFNFNKASLLQGVIMQNIDAEYAERLHNQGLKPYSQCIRMEQNRPVWYIRALTSEAEHYIIQPLLDNKFQEFYLEHDEKTVKIMDKEYTSLPIDDLFHTFYTKTAARSYIIEFLSPTAFKKNGKYYFYPNIYNIYYSIMQRFDCISQKESMFNEETLLQLTDNTEITAYSIYSVNFSMEGVRIPAYMGKITIRIKGPQTMVNFANLLLQFGNYSGVGIKTAMGMGSIHVTERRRKIDK